MLCNFYTLFHLSISFKHCDWSEWEYHGATAYRLHRKKWCPKNGGNKNGGTENGGNGENGGIKTGGNGGMEKFDSIFPTGHLTNRHLIQRHLPHQPFRICPIMFLLAAPSCFENKPPCWKWKTLPVKWNIIILPAFKVFVKCIIKRRKNSCQ